MLIIDSLKLQKAMLKGNIGTLELCKLSGLPKKTVSGFMGADKRARNTTINKIASSLGVEPLTICKTKLEGERHKPSMREIFCSYLAKLITTGELEPEEEKSLYKVYERLQMY